MSLPARIPVDVPEPRDAARSAGLRYVDDARPGLRRARAGHGFRYVGPDGRTVRDPAVLRRIKALAIPPAWTEVWICPFDNGHVQATGRDQRGRKQYRYHARWREVRDETKFERMRAFGAALPRIRARVDEDLRRQGLPREKVLATVVRLLETTFIRVGNEEYAKNNASFGLTTLRNRHVAVRGATLRFRFRGKSGKEVAVSLEDRRLARIVRQCQDLPGHELFSYVDDDGAVRDVDSADVNAYLKEVSGEDFTAKDFRTWAGTVLAAIELCGMEPCATATAAKKSIVAAVKTVAARLGNTPAVCRRHYVHPAVIEAFEQGTLQPVLRRLGPVEAGADPHALRPIETAIVKMLG